jgi:protein-S-isoprenylcysteine O-methyltransferase Ste14
VTVIVLSETLLARSGSLAVYWVLWFLGANLIVIGYEEPTLRQMFGASYEDYVRRVGRWIPTLRVPPTER